MREFELGILTNDEDAESIGAGLVGIELETTPPV